jgi:hypothetical protein
MYKIISYHDSSYQPLADITWNQNKIPYCEQHGYQLSYEPLEGVGHPGQLQKVRMINQELENPELEWLWWTGCDLMITNFTTKIEDKIDNNYNMVIATDCNGFNADSILIRNNEESRAYWKMIAEVLPSLYWHWEGEQKIIKDTYPNHKKKIKVVPQRDINSYNYDTYNGAYQPFDHLGTNGNWQPGDWVIQWPGLALDYRIKLAEYYTQQIVR